MKVIIRNYSEYFYFWPIDDEKKHDSIMKWEYNSGQPIVVFHPLLSFDPISTLERQRQILARERDEGPFDYRTEKKYDKFRSFYDPIADIRKPIVHEEIKVRCNFFKSLEPFLGDLEWNFKFNPGDGFWSDTGCWTAKDNKYSYMGLSEESALMVWDQSSDVKLCYIASSESTLLEFYLDKLEENSFSLNIYYANKYNVFPDSIDAVHRALDKIGEWKRIKIETKDHDDIFAINHKNRSLIEKGDIESFTIKPQRVIPYESNLSPETEWFFAVVVENTFFTINDQIKKPEGYVILEGKGGLSGEDFNEDKEYIIFYSMVRKLEHCHLVELLIDEITEGDDFGFLNWPYSQKLNDL